MIVVTAATGNIGQALVEDLLARGQKVRAVARDPKKLEPLAARGAEIALADLSDAAFTAKAFQGATAAFTLIPPRYDAPDLRAYYKQVSQGYVEAIRSAGVKHVVNLSSLGAHLGEKNGPIAGLHDHEERLNALAGVNVLHLRPTYFMENFFFNVGLIKSQGVNGSPLRPDLRMPMIATRDIARVAAEKLTARAFTGRSVLELHGERDLTLAEVTRVLGASIGRPDLAYVQFPYEAAREALVGLGLSPNVADLFNEMYRGFNEGVIRPTQSRPLTTTPTSIEEFAKTFAAVYHRN